MSDPLSKAIVREVAEQAARRVTRKLIAELQSMDSTMFGSDSGLKSVWEEVCVQLQHEPSFYWDVYDETVRSLLVTHVESLTIHERHSLWLQTDAGWNWSHDEPEDRDPNPVDHPQIVDYLADESIYPAAHRWSNRRIRDYIERGQSID